MADGSINQLNFEVILNDKDFNSKLQNLQTLANQFNITMSQALTLSKVKATTKDVADLEKAIKGASSAQTTLNQAMNKMPAGKMSQYAQGLKQTNIHLAGATNIMRTLSQLTGVAFGAMGIRRFLSTLIDVTGQFEVQKMALGAMLQDADKADKIFGQFRQLALESPYTFQEFTKFGKQLTAFNIPAEKLVGTTKMLADVAAGLGVDMQRIILAYGQIKSAGVLKGMELRQLTEAGVPILDSLAKQIEKTTGKTVQLAEIFDMISKKQIPFAMVEQAFRDMTTEGGRFYNMQEVLVETLAGKIGKLKDTWQQALYDIGSAQSGILKGSVDLITNIVANYDKLGRVIYELVGIFGAYKASLAVTTAISKGYTLAQIRQRAATIAVEKAQALLNATLLKNPYVLVAAAATALAYGMYKLATNQTLAEKTSNELAKAVSKAEVKAMEEVSTLDKLSMKLEALSSDTDEWKRAKSEVIQQFGKYKSNLDEEITKVGNLSTVYGELRKKIAEAAKAKMYQSFVDTQTTNLTKISDDALDKYINGIADRDISEGLKKELLGLVKSYVYEGQELTKSQAFALSMSGLGKYLEEAREAYSSLIGIDKQAREAFGITDDLLKDLQGDAEEANDAIKTLGNSVPDVIKEIKSLEASLKKDRERAATGVGLTDEEIKKIETDEATLKKYKNLYKTLTGQDYDVKKTTTKGSEDLAKQEKTIKSQISNLQKLKESYDKLAQNPLIGEENATSLMERFYGETDLDFERRIRELASALIQLNPELDEYVKGIHDAFGKDAADEYLKSLSEFDSISDKISDYLSESFEIDGEKVGYKISKALTDLFNKNVKVDLKVDDMVKDLEKAKAAITTQYLVDNTELFKEAGVAEEQQRKMADAFWDEYKRRRIEEITEQSAQEKKANEQSTQEKIRGFASDIYKQLSGSLNLTEWSHKSIRELENIKQVLSSLDVPEDIKALLGEDGELLDKLREALKELAQQDIDKADERETEKKAKKWGAIASHVSSAASALEEFGEAAGNDDIKQLAHTLGLIASSASAVIESFASDDPTKIITNAISIFTTEIIGAITATAKLKQAIKDAAEESRRLSFTEALSKGVDSIFGSNDLNKLNNAVANIEKLRNLTNADRENGRSVQTSKGAKWWEFLLAPTSTAAWAKTFTRTTDTIAGMASKLGRSLYDEYGNLNAETLQTILNTYTNLKQADRDWITQAINNSEAYAEAMEQLNDVVESIIGDIASSAADTLVDGWIEAGKAALDYADILDDVAKSYSKMLVKSMIIDSLEENTQAIKRAFANNDYQTAMSLVNDAMAQIEQLAPGIEEILSAFDPYYKREESERTASSKGLVSNFSQDTIDYWSGQLTLLVQYARRGDEQREAITNLVMALRDNMGGGGNGDYTSNVQTYLATIQGDTTAIRGDIYAMKLAIQNMNDKGVKML